MILRYGGLFFGLFAAVASGCGGTDGERATTQLREPVVYDAGSKPVLCSVGDDYEFSTIQDFETNSVAGGWYFNNDQCDRCQKIIDRIKELKAITVVTQLEYSAYPVYPDKYGCSDWRQLKSEEESTEEYASRIAPIIDAYTKEQEIRERQLIEGDPDNNVPPNCRAVCLASQFPDTYIKPLAASRIEFTLDGKKYEDQPRCGSRFAMHVKGGPFQTWGGAFAVQLGQPGLDASDWEGISFWARVGPTSRHPLRIEISDPHTDDKQMVYRFEGDEQVRFVTQADLIQRDPTTNAITENHFDAPDDASTWCKQKQFICNADSVREDRNGCDKFGANRSMSGDWQFFTVDFSTLRQSGWGAAATEPILDPNGNAVPIDKSQLRSINFMWTTGLWDVWIDDIALYRRKQP